MPDGPKPPALPSQAGNSATVLNASAMTASNVLEQYQPFLEDLHDCALILDRRFRIVFANFHFYELSGILPLECLAKPFSALFQKSMIHTLNQHLRLLRKGQKATFEAEFQTKAGSPLRILLSCTPFADDDKSFNGAIVIIIDVTTKSLIHDAVLNAKKEWERTFDVINDYIFIVDQNNIIRRVNIALANFLNVHPRELIGKRCETTFDFCMQHITRTPPDYLIAQNKSIRREIHSYVLDGYYQVSVHPFSGAKADSQGFVYVIRNLKKQKELQDALYTAHKLVELKVEQRTQDLRQANIDLVRHIRDKEAFQKERTRLAAIIEQVGEGIVLTDTDWSISYVNPAFSRMTGIDEDTAASEKMNFLGFIQHPFLTQEKMEDLLQTKGVWLGRFTKYREDGVRYDVKAQIFPLKDEHGNITNYFGMLSDVTQEVRLERRIRNAEKMEVIGIFAAGIAHDFNNILGGIIGSIELAEDVLDENDEQAREDLQEALGYADQAKNLVHQILTFKHQHSLTVFPLQAAAVMEETLDSVGKLLPEGVRIARDIRKTPWLLLANVTHIQQILINVCMNAAHAMDNQGIIEVSMTGERLEHPLQVHDTVLPPGEYIHITVKDSGCGIAREIRENIFEPFFSTKKSAGGTGMGLPIVNTVAQRLGGGISIDSEHNQGTTFHVYLPRCVSSEDNL